MDRNSHHEVVRALAEILHEDLAQRQTVTIPNWGTFAIEHQTARAEKTHEGATALLPPQDTITFEPEHA